MRLDEVKDTAVMSIAEGIKLGSVHELLLDDSYLQIAALVIGGGDCWAVSGRRSPTGMYAASAAMP